MSDIKNDRLRGRQETVPLSHRLRRNGRVLTIPEARDRHDKSIRGYKTKFKTDPEHAKAEVDLIIKNTYRTLMTRGMKGCYVYCTDEETAAYFRASI